MLSHADLFDVQHAAERRKDRDFILQRAQFAGGDGPEARVPQGGEGGHVPNGNRERLHGSYVADAAAQLAVFPEGDERAALLRQRLQPHGWRVLVLLVISHGAFHGLAGDLEQLVLLPLAEGEGRLARAGTRRGFHEGHGAVAYHAGLVAGRYIAGVGVV